MCRPSAVCRGVTLYEMVTGRAPFKGGTPLDTLSAILNESALPPSQLNADVPAQLEQILAKCLEKDPKERYQDTQDLAVDLRKLRGSTGAEVSAFRGAQRRSTRWPLALAGAVAVVIIGCSMSGTERLLSRGDSRVREHGVPTPD